MAPSPPRPALAAAALAAASLVMAVGTAGSAVVPPAAPAAPRVARMVASSSPDPSPAQPWFAMTVTPASISFVQPAQMPVGAPPMKAAAGILVDMDTGQVLWSLDPDRPLPPASTTKVLTALVALENLDPGQEVIVTPGALGQTADDTVMGLHAGDVLSVQELLEGMLLPSGDDAASAIAVDTVGESRFLAAMNAQVSALGLHDSNFTNTSGLDDPGLYASAYDLAVIATDVYDRYPLFDRIVQTPSLELPATTGHPAFHLENLDALLQDYPAAVGIKPGWTGNAGACLIGMAVRGGHRLMAVLMNADYPARLEARLLDWGFSVEGLPPLLPPTPAPTPTARARR